jgi:hypothetical protein
VWITSNTWKLLSSTVISRKNVAGRSCGHVTIRNLVHADAASISAASSSSIRRVCSAAR